MPKEEEVGAGVEIFAENLFGRHVRNGAQGGAGTGELMESTPMVASVSAVRVVPARVLRLLTLARPKSKILAWPRLVTKMLAGLMSR